MRVAINLLTETPQQPSGAHWFWTRIIPEIAQRMDTDEELHFADLRLDPVTREAHRSDRPFTSSPSWMCRRSRASVTPNVRSSMAGAAVEGS